MIDTPRTCPHCSELVEPHHEWCGACSYDMSGGSAPLSLLGENPQVYGSMGAYYPEPDEPIDRSKYPTLLSDPRVKQREAPGTPTDRLASVGEGPCPLAEPCHLHPRRHEPREPPAPASPDGRAMLDDYWRAMPVDRQCVDCGQRYNARRNRVECEFCGGLVVVCDPPATVHRAERIAAAQQNVLEAAKAWNDWSQPQGPNMAALIEALDDLAEAEKGEGHGKTDRRPMPGPLE